MRKKLEEHRGKTEDIEKMWEQQKRANVNSAQEVIGYRKGKSKPWINENTWNLIDERKDIKTKIESTRPGRVKTRLKENYRETKHPRKVRERGQEEMDAAVRSKDGELPKIKKQGLPDGANIFEEVLNIDTPESPPQDEQEEGEELDISVEPPTMQEIRVTQKKLQNGKDPWSRSNNCRDFKRGNLQDCSNWRGVKLLPQGSKALSRIVINGIQAGVDCTLRIEQTEFRRVRRTVNQIFIFRNIIEQVNEWNATLYIHFVDSVHRDSLWVIMKRYGMHKKSRPLINWVMQQTVRGNRTGIRWDFTTMLEDLDFADDTALLSSAMNHLQSKTTKLEEKSAKVRLKLNAKKCKVIID
ncbi:uncharacterized protein LOC134251894 [Saccostrea cucullata]|uniref:uncharacterized protein LOC134251894 n=1 Tax=Saccostrea cuccullata TaxID=36930 RepID=UPI002ECFF2E7